MNINYHSDLTPGVFVINEDKKNDDKEVIDSMTKLLLNTMTEENKESLIDEALKSDNPKLSLLDLLKED